MNKSKITLPIFPYLKKYLVKSPMFANQSAPYVIDEDTLIGKQIMASLLDRRVPAEDMAGDKMIQPSERIDFLVSNAMAKRGPTQSRLSKPINYYLDKLFKNTLITWIQSSEIAGVNAYQASKSFLVYFRIDESEYSHDAAYKYWTRWKRQGIKK